MDHQNFQIWYLMDIGIKVEKRGNLIVQVKDFLRQQIAEIKKQKDIWTFGRTMGASNPNWQLVATGG